MGDVIFISGLVSLIYALVAIILVGLALRLLDRIGGFKFKECMEEMSDEPQSMAIYLGLRFLGACLLLGLVISG